MNLFLCTSQTNYWRNKYRQVERKHNQQIKKLLEQLHKLTSRTNRQFKGIIFQLESQMSLNKSKFREIMRDAHDFQTIRHTDPSESRHKPKQVSVDGASTPQPPSSNEGSDLASASSSSIASSSEYGLSNQDDLDGHFRTSNHCDMQQTDYKSFPHLMSGRSDCDSDGTHAGVPIPAAGLQIHVNSHNHGDNDDDDRASVITLKPSVSQISIGMNQYQIPSHTCRDVPNSHKELHVDSQRDKPDTHRDETNSLRDKPNLHSNKPNPHKEKQRQRGESEGLREFQEVYKKITVRYR